jgi:predicted nucleic acid-binding protein
VIVGSILLAFAIDAAWDLRREQALDDDALRALTAEIEQNEDQLRRYISIGGGARRAQLELIGLVGPNPIPISQDSLARLVRTSWGFSVAEIQSGALDAAMDRTTPTTNSRRELLRLMRAYRIQLDDHVEDGQQWMELRAEFVRQIGTVAPAAFLWGGTAVHGPTDFPVPVRAILSDQRLEGVVSQLTIRAYQMIGTMEDIRAVADSVRIAAEEEIR